MMILLIYSGLANDSKDYLNSILKHSKTSNAPLTGKSQLNLYDTLEKHVRQINRQFTNRENMISFYQVQVQSLNIIVDILQQIRDNLIRKTDFLLSADDKVIINQVNKQLFNEVISQLKGAQFNGIYIYKEFFSDPQITQYIDFYLELELADVDAMLKYFIRSRSTLGSKIRMLSHRQKSEASASANLTEFQSKEAGAESLNMIIKLLKIE